MPLLNYCLIILNLCIIKKKEKDIGYLMLDIG
jgi:hypothetical protein